MWAHSRQKGGIAADRAASVLDAGAGQEGIMSSALEPEWEIDVRGPEMCKVCYWLHLS